MSEESGRKGTHRKVALGDHADDPHGMDNQSYMQSSRDKRFVLPSRGRSSSPVTTAASNRLRLATRPRSRSIRHRNGKRSARAPVLDGYETDVEDQPEQDGTFGMENGGITTNESRQSSELDAQHHKMPSPAETQATMRSPFHHSAERSMPEDEDISHQVDITQVKSEMGPQDVEQRKEAATGNEGLPHELKLTDRSSSELSSLPSTPMSDPGPYSFSSLINRAAQAPLSGQTSDDPKTEGPGSHVLYHSEDSNSTAHMHIDDASSSDLSPPPPETPTLNDENHALQLRTKYIWLNPRFRKKSTNRGFRKSSVRNTITRGQKASGHNAAPNALLSLDENATNGDDDVYTLPREAPETLRPPTKEQIRRRARWPGNEAKW